MNRRVSFCCAALLGIGCLIPLAKGQATPGAAPAAPAAPAGGASQVPDLKLNQGAIPTPAEQQQMSQWVTALLAFIDAAPADQKVVRDRLINYMPQASNAQVEPRFTDTYARVLDDALVAVLKAKPSVRAKVLVGVIAAKSAARAEDYSHPLSDVTELLLQDSNEAVVLWGMQSAKAVLPGKLALGGNMYANLLNQIVPVASKFPGPVLEEAYETLTLSPRKLKQNQQQLAQAAIAAQVKIVIPEVQKLLAKRLADWANGVPKQPAADTSAITFLSIPGVWSLQNQGQQRTTLVSTHEFLTRTTTAFMAATTDREKDELKEVTGLGAGGLQIMAQYLKDPTLEGAASNLRKISRGSQNAQVQELMGAVTSAFNANPMSKVPASAGAPTTQSSASPIGQAAVSK